MKICLNCGQQIDDTASVCPFCGAPAQQGQTPLDATLPGYVYPGVNAPAFAPVTQKKSKKKAVILSVIIAAVVIAACVSLYFVFFTGYEGVWETEVKALRYGDLPDENVKAAVREFPALADVKLNVTFRLEIDPDMTGEFTMTAKVDADSAVEAVKAMAKAQNPGWTDSEIEEAVRAQNLDFSSNDRSLMKKVRISGDKLLSDESDSKGKNLGELSRIFNTLEWEYALNGEKLDKETIDAVKTFLDSPVSFRKK